MPLFKQEVNQGVEVAILLRANGKVVLLLRANGKVLVELPIQIPIPTMRIGVSTVDTGWLKRQLAELRQYKSGFSRN